MDADAKDLSIMDTDWTYPRVSFSQDFASTLEVGCGDGLNQSTSSSYSVETPKWQAASTDVDDDDDGDYSAEFEFSKHGRSLGEFPHTKDIMLSADELFLNGKLLPLHLSRMGTLAIPSSSLDDLCLPWNSEKQLKFSLQKPYKNKPMVRHLSFEISKSSTCPNFDPVDSSDRACLRIDSCCVSSPFRPSRVPDSTSDPISPKTAPIKYSSKIKGFFKAKKASKEYMTCAQITNYHNTMATCRLPISPRSFWPFSRSNSAGEPKTTTPIPSLPPRSNSAGETVTSRDQFVGERCKAGDEAVEQSNSISKCSTLQVPGISACRDGEQASVSREQPAQCSNAIISIEDARKTAVMRMKGSGSPGRYSRRKIVYSTASFARGSPGRRGGLNGSGVNVNSGKIILRNLERCSAEKKLARTSRGVSERRGSFPVAVKVAPVVNVGFHMGKTSNVGLFGFVNLFTSKKDRERPLEGPVNNWRNGA